MNCITLNCKNKVLCKNLCTKCYYRIKRGGTPEISKKQQAALRKCSVLNCNKPHFSNNFCEMHRRRWKIHGDPLFVNPKCNRDEFAKTRAKAYRAQWKKDNWETYKHYLAARKSRVKTATPPWANLHDIELFYKNCPTGFHVDHNIPLNGKNVCGLHILENLKYLPAKENLRKSNKF